MLYSLTKYARFTAVFISISVLDSSHSLASKTSTNPDKKEVARPKIEVCFVLDTTGSMGGLIQGAKDKIWSIANELVNTEPTPEIKFSLIGYRDRTDDYVTKVTDLTDDLDAIHTTLMAFAADGGGDSPESVNQALNESVSKISWTEGRQVLKIIFLVGDAPPHMDYKGEKQYPEICHLAVKNDLIINAIQCGRDAKTASIWQEIARKSEGSFAAIQQNGGTVAIATPFDAEISKYNHVINSTVVGYGTPAQQIEVARKVTSNEKSSFEAQADRIAFMSKSARIAGGGLGGGGGRAIGGENDLVELLINDKLAMDEIEVDQLPPDLKKLSEKEQQVELQKRIDLRKENRKKVDELIRNRSDYIANQNKNMEKKDRDSFDAKVKAMIRKQAATRGIEYSKSK